MRKLLLLMFALLTGVSGAWATDVTWESLHGWTQSSGGVGGFKWYGVHTPGDNTITYTMSSIQLKQASGSSNTNYLAIATVSPGSSSTIAETNVLAVSSNSITATTSTLYEYTFTTPVTLTGGTTYYLVFVSANTPTNGAYTIQTGRMEVNHVKYDKNFTYGPYSYGNSANVDWWPYFTATLTTSAAITNYNYSCKNLAGYEFCSGTLPQASAPTKDQAPNLGDYYSCQSVSIDGTDVTFTYALTENPLASATTPAGDIATNPKYTTIESVAGQFVYYAEDGGDVKGDKNYSKDGNDAHWIIVGDEANGYKLYNANTGTSKVAVVADGNDKEIQMLSEASNTASLFDIRYISGAYRLYKKGTKYCTNRLSSNTLKIGIHENVNDGSKTTVTRYSKTVTYKLKWNNSEIASESVSVPTGDATSDHLPSTWNRAYCNYTYDVSNVTTETSTVNVTMTWDGPFDISSDFNSAKWYYLKVNGKWAVYGNFTYNSILITQPYDNESNAQNAIAKSMWAFVGNPYDGFEIMNRHAGSGMYLDSQSGTAMFMSPSNTYTTFKIGQKEGAVFSMNNSGYYINCGDSYIAANSGVSENATSSLTVEDIPYKFLALAYLPEYAASHHMGQYFGVDENSYNSVMTTITNATSITENVYNDLVSNINSYLSPKLPETGYYRIKSSGSRGDQSYITYGYLDGSKGTGLLTTIGNKETDLGTVVKLTRVGSSKNYKISIQGLNVQAHSGDNTLFRATGAEGLNFHFNHINFSGMCSIDDGTNHGNMHEADWKKPDTGLNGVVGWDAGDGTNASSWSVEDATSIEVTLNNGGDGFYYATCFTDFPVSYDGASNGEGLFVLTGGESNGKVTAQKVAAVPAQQGFLIRIAAENVTDSKVTLTIPASADALTGTNILTGTCLATTKPDGNVYVFSKVGDDLGFFPYTGTDNIPANRAYIVESDGNVRSFILSFEDTTGINGVSTSMPAGTIFDMQGRRVQTPARGLYIVNGKKVLF